VAPDSQGRPGSMKTHRGGTARPRAGRERSQRQLRVGEMLRHALVEILARDELRDPALAGVPVTVTEVRISPDLRSATAFVIPLGGAGGGADAVVKALNHAVPFLRRQLGEHVTLRRLPTLGFVYDETFDEGARIDGLLRSPAVRRDTAPRPDDEPDGA